MHNHDLSSWRHDHRFHADRVAAERGTRLVALVTAVTMVLEIATGWWLSADYGNPIAINLRDRYKSGFSILNSYT